MSQDKCDKGKFQRNSLAYYQKIKSNKKRILIRILLLWALNLFLHFSYSLFYKGSIIYFSCLFFETAYLYRSLL